MTLISFQPLGLSGLLSNKSQSLHPYLGIHLKNSKLVTGNTEQRSMRSSSLEKNNSKCLSDRQWHEHSIWLVTNSTSPSWDWQLTLRQPLVATGKQQSSCCLFWPSLLWVLVESYPDAFSWCCAAAFRSLSFTESWKVEQVSRAPLPGEKSCVTANLLHIQLLLVPDLQGWLMFPNKFKASLFSLFPKAIYE